MRRGTCQSRALVGIGATVLLLLLSSTLVGLARSAPTQQQFPSLSNSSDSQATHAAASGPHRIASCLPNGATFGWPKVDAAYDPADGYMYVAVFDALTVPYGEIFVVQDPCTVVKKIILPYGADVYGPGTMAYDPVIKAMVAIDDFNQVADILRGGQLVQSFGGFGQYPSHVPHSIAWDPSRGVMLVGDLIGPVNGVDLLYLNESNGTLSHAIVLDAFDHGNAPNSILVADGYIFSTGNRVDVFNDTTFAYVGTYPNLSGFWDLTWDPLNDTVVGAYAFAPYPPHPENYSLVFLNVSSIQHNSFTYRFLHTTDILIDGIGGVAYSPSDHNIYFDAEGGYDLWYLTPHGKLGHVWIENPPKGGYGDGILWGVAYDAENQDMYVCGSSLYVVS